jgi:phytoene dehydrogenase-like protein
MPKRSGQDDAIARLFGRARDRCARDDLDVRAIRDSTLDAVVVGAGPNELAAAITLAREGRTVRQLFTRPVARIDPYSTPDPRPFLCSSPKPPGGGIHGMCGWHAAHSALRRLGAT